MFVLDVLEDHIQLESYTEALFEAYLPYFQKLSKENLLENISKEGEYGSFSGKGFAPWHHLFSY